MKLRAENLKSLVKFTQIEPEFKAESDFQAYVCPLLYSVFHQFCFFLNQASGQACHLSNWQTTAFEHHTELKFKWPR